MTRPKCNICGSVADFRCYIWIDKSHTYAINRCRTHMNEKEYIVDFDIYKEPFDPRPLSWSGWALSDGRLHDDWVISLEELSRMEKLGIIKLPNKYEDV